MFNDERIGGINVIILIVQNYFYLTRRTQRAQSYYLTVDAGAGIRRIAPVTRCTMRGGGTLKG